MVKLAGVDEDAPKVIGALLEFPNTVDNRIIRLTGLQVIISCFHAIYVICNQKVFDINSRIW